MFFESLLLYLLYIILYNSNRFWLARNLDPVLERGERKFPLCVEGKPVLQATITIEYEIE